MKALVRLFLVLSAPIAGLSISRADVAIGDPFPAVTGESGATAAVPSTEGKVAIIDFWASWCAPCRASFPAYGRLSAAYAPKGLVIVGVSVDDNPKDYASFVKKFSPPFAVLLDRDHQLVRQVSVPTMPTCYVVDRHGRVRYIHAGYHGAATDEALRREVDLLLDAK